MATVATVNPVTMPSLGRSDVSDEEREPGAKAEGVKIEKDLLGLLFKKLEENDRHLEENLQSRKRTERLLVETRIELLQARKQLRVAEKERNDFWAAYQASLKTQSVFKERLESIEKQLSDEIGKNKQLTQENTTLKKNRDWLSNRNQQLDERLKKAQEDLQRAEVELRKLQQNKEESEIFIDETLNQQYLSDIMSRSEIQRLTQENQRLEETNKEAYAVITKEISVIDRRASERLRQAQFQGKVIGGAIGTGIGAVGGGMFGGVSGGGLAAGGGMALGAEIGRRIGGSIFEASSQTQSDRSKKERLSGMAKKMESSSGTFLNLYSR